MTLLDSIVLGALEGATEFLPVSSTGHLILAGALLHIPQTDAFKSFEIAIQLGSIAAVAILFWRQFLDLEVLKRLAVAFVPTGLIGFVLYHFIKGFLIGNQLVVVIALAAGGAAILAIERLAKPAPGDDADVRAITYRQSALIGLAQAFAVIPGVSRSGATVMGGLLMKIPRAAILRFSFLLAVPTMLAATGYDLVKTPDALSGTNAPLLATGFLVAFAVALVSVRAVTSYVRRHSFAAFGVYRIALALLFALFFL